MTLWDSIFISGCFIHELYFITRWHAIVSIGTPTFHGRHCHVTELLNQTQQVKVVSNMAPYKAINILSTIEVRFTANKLVNKQYKCFLCRPNTQEVATIPQNLVDLLSMEPWAAPLASAAVPPTLVQVPNLCPIRFLAVVSVIKVYSWREEIKIRNLDSVFCYCFLDNNINK